LKTCLKGFLKSLKIVGEFVLKFDLKKRFEFKRFEIGLKLDLKRKEKKKKESSQPNSTLSRPTTVSAHAARSASLPSLSLSDR
jgi:hypothetical protein